MLTQEEKWLLTEKYNDVENDAFYADRARLKAGEPLAYLIGSIPFLNTTIYLDSRPLIPRVETEWWVNICLKTFKKNSSLKILDLCAGSGCIGIALLKNLSGSDVTFAELDVTHLHTIKKNCEANKIASDQYTLVQSDLFSNIQERFDLIVSNPPYIDPCLQRTEVSVTAHEPHTALYGGTAGMRYISQIITGCKKFLNPEGVLYLEHEPEQSTPIHSLANNQALKANTYLDQYGKARYTVLSKLN